MARNLEKQLNSPAKFCARKHLIRFLLIILPYFLLLFLDLTLFFATFFGAIIGVSFWILFSSLERKQNTENVAKIDYFQSIISARNDIEYCGNPTYFRDKLDFINYKNYTNFALLIDNIVCFLVAVLLFLTKHDPAQIILSVCYLKFTFYTIKIF